MKKTTRILWGGFLALMLFHAPVFAKQSDMPDSYDGMTQLKEKVVYRATGKEEWSKTTGFGANTTMNDMMNEMMVGGSGMENMKMNMTMPGSSETENDPMKMAEGSNMEGMDMSGGKDMKGMEMGKTKKKFPPTAQTPVSIQASLKEGKPKVGKNTLVLTALDPATGKPSEKLKISAKVFMTSMDMGTDKPKVEELGKGQYQVKVAFGMAGPWRVELNIALPDKKPFVKDLDFDVQMPE